MSISLKFEMEAKTDYSNAYLLYYQHACPLCTHEKAMRVERHRWMYLIPGSLRLECLGCGNIYMAFKGNTQEIYVREKPLDTIKV
jgi:hypothetical protein